MKIFIVRGGFLNPFELQNYVPLKEKYDITAVSSKYPISDKIDLPLIKLWSPTDLPNFPFKFPILNRIFTDAHKLFGLERVIEGADIVHVAETYYGYTHQAVVAKRRGLIKKIVSTVWEIIPHNNEGIRGRKEYKKLAGENIDHFIAVTEMAKAALVKEGISEAKITVIPIGIDLQKFKPGKKEKVRSINILCVARLVPEKGIEDLVEAFLKIREKNNNVHLTLVGSGHLKQDYSNYRHLHIKSVPYSKIQNEYREANIFCLPSKATKTWQEQYGMALVEAMACGLPIVTTATGAIPEVCGDVALYSQSTVPSLQTNLEMLINDPELRYNLAEKSRARAEANFDRLKISEKINAVYQSLVKH